MIFLFHFEVISRWTSHQNVQGFLNGCDFRKNRPGNTVGTYPHTFPWGWIFWWKIFPVDFQLSKIYGSKAAGNVREKSPSGKKKTCHSINSFHPRKLHQRMTGWRMKMYLLLNMVFFHCHVTFRGGISTQSSHSCISYYPGKLTSCC